LALPRTISIALLVLLLNTFAARAITHTNVPKEYLKNNNKKLG